MTCAHYLVPISPFGDGGGASGREWSDVGVQGGRPTPLPMPLKLPGKFGREELLRPFSKVCPTCSSRGRRRRENGGDGDDGRQRLCAICLSIQSLAKFIPRKEFWCFSHPERGNDDDDDDDRRRRLQLAISGRDTVRLVRIVSSGGGVVTSLDDTSKKDPQLLELHDGDIVSLLWHNVQRGGDGAMDYASSALEPLVQFRLAIINCETPRVAAGDYFLDNQVGVSLLIDPSNAIEENRARRIQGNRHETENDHEKGSQDRDVDNQNDAKKHATHDNKDHFSSSSSSSSLDEEHHFNIGSFVRNVTKEEDIMARVNCVRDVRGKYGDVFRESKSERKVGNGRSEQTANGTGDDACVESIKSSSCDEGESGSAPLSLPSRFLASYSKSFSFDSAERPPSVSYTSSGFNIAECVWQSTPQKSNLTRKRKFYDDMESSEAANTPKKSNVTIADKYASVSISSLSRDQLIQLQKEATPPDFTEQTSPSLRRIILSLTLKLTSNASSYVSNFTNDCRAEANLIPPTQGRQWIPRLLRGTQIKTLQKY